MVQKYHDKIKNVCSANDGGQNIPVIDMELMYIRVPESEGSETDQFVS